MGNPRVLLAAPTSIHKDYCVHEWATLIKNLSYDNYEIYIVDNSPEQRTIWSELGIKNDWISPKGKTSQQFITESQALIRHYFLNNEFDYLFFLESDLFPPIHILDYLVALNKPVAGCPYFIYKGDETILMNQEINTLIGSGLTRNYSIDESYNFFDGTLKRAFAIGFGCVLIKRDVLELIEFKFKDSKNIVNDTDSFSHADSFFYADCFMKNVPVYLDTSIVIEHRNQDWKKILAKF